jgi:hypothetical protein
VAGLWIVIGRRLSTTVVIRRLRIPPGGLSTLRKADRCQLPLLRRLLTPDRSGLVDRRSRAVVNGNDYGCCRRCSPVRYAPSSNSSDARTSREPTRSASTRGTFRDGVSALPIDPTAAPQCCRTASCPTSRHRPCKPIEKAWSFRPELEVVLILNVPPREDAAVEKYARSFWKYHWPWTRKPAVFYDPRGPEKTPGSPSCQHAKCILVDGVTAFITSANFTESAHERNIELGVLFRENPRVAQSIRLKFESLIQNGFLKPLPAR